MHHLHPGPDPAPVQARITLPAIPGAPVIIECPDHGPMTWQAMAWRCALCPVMVTEAHMARLARWLGGDGWRP